MSITLPKLDPIDFLVLRKFPNADNIEVAYRKPKPINPVGSRDNSRNDRIFAELKLHYEAVQEYRKKLAAKSSEELDALFKEEQAKSEEELRLKAETEEQGRFWNQPCAQADYDHWSKTSYWTLEEAIALSFGKDPNSVNWARLQKIVLYPTSPFIEQYKKLRDIVLRAKAWNHLYDPALPGFYISWARGKDISFPKELEEKVVARGGNIADWQSAYDSLEKISQTKYNALEELYNTLKNLSDDGHKKAMDILDKKNAQILTLMQEKADLESNLAELEKQKQKAAEKPLKTERNTLLKMAFGMAKAWYGYDPEKTRSNSVAEIKSDLERHGAPMDDETIRKYLRLGAELFPKTVEKS